MATYRIWLTDQERQQLKSTISTGKRKAAHIRDAHILLASDFGSDSYQSETSIAGNLHLSTPTVERTRKTFFEQGMGLFEVKPRKVRSDVKIDGRIQAHLVAISCSESPPGQSHWALQTIADRAVALNIIDAISHTSVGKVLKKMKLSLGGKKDG